MAEGEGQGGPQPPRPDGPSSVGEMLRAARLRRQLTLEAVEAETRVRRRFLQALEEDRLDELPGAVYAKGFVKLYARAVGLDPDDVSRRLDQQLNQGPRARVRERSSGGRERSAPGRVAGGSWPWWSMPDPILKGLEPARRIRHAGLLAVLVVAVAGTGAWLLSRPSRPPAAPAAVALMPALPAETAPDGPGAVPGTLVEQPAPRPGPVDGEASGTGQAPQPATAEGAIPPSAAAAPVDQAGSPADGAGAAGGGLPGQDGPPVAAPVVLRARVHDRSWMEVWADGRRIFSRTAVAGEELVWTAQSQLTVRFGRPEVVELELNGRPLGVAGTGVITRTFTAAGELATPARQGLSARPAGAPAEPLMP